MKKCLFILCLAFLCRTILSCTCNCPEKTIIDYKANAINLTLIDNSQSFAIVIDSNQQIPAAALGLELTLSDTTFYNHQYYYSYLPKNNAFGFTNSYAFSCDCDGYDFIPTTEIQSINIVTLLDYSSTIISGTDVSELFVCRQNKYDDGQLYLELCDLIMHFNNQTLIDEPYRTFSLFNKEAIENTEAQFQISVQYSDQTRQVITSPIIHLKQAE